MIGKWFGRRYNRHVDGPKKVEKILKVLNKGITDKSKWVWEEAEGYHTFGSVTLSERRVSFDIGRGVIVKLFINKNTGETRPYFYKFVVRDEDAPS